MLALWYHPGLLHKRWLCGRFKPFYCNDKHLGKPQLFLQRIRKRVKHDKNIRPFIFGHPRQFSTDALNKFDQASCGPTSHHFATDSRVLKGSLNFFLQSVHPAPSRTKVVHARIVQWANTMICIIRLPVHYVWMEQLPWTVEQPRQLIVVSILQVKVWPVSPANILVSTSRLYCQVVCKMRCTDIGALRYCFLNFLKRFFL